MNGNDCKALLKKIREIDFALQETVLYLDAYPNNRRALAYYQKMKAEREMAVAAYEASCGPLTMYGNDSATSWDWINGPWPWEAEAN